MVTTILILMILAAILLIVVILIQNPKGGGLSSEFGGGSSQMFGVQKTGDILEKLTWGFFAFLLVGALGTGILARLDSSSQTSDSDENVERSTTAPSFPAPTPPPVTALSNAPAGTPAPTK